MYFYPNLGFAPRFQRERDLNEVIIVVRQLMPADHYGESQRTIWSKATMKTPSKKRRVKR
jgi:hypothetical protein